MFEPELLTVGDFNGDGNLDLAITQHLFSEVSVMLGKGDGTFPAHVEYSCGFSPFGIVVADVNGDGKIDLATIDYGDSNVATLSLFLGNGDGSFQNHLDFPDGGFGGGAIAQGDLDGNGSIDLVFTNRVQASISVLLNTPVIAIAPIAVAFPAQTVGTQSQPQAITIGNPGSAPLVLNSIGMAGSNPGDFSSNSTCSGALGAGKSCTVSMAFAPQRKGARQAFVDVKHNAPSREQHVSLVGTGTYVLLSSSSLGFGDQDIGTVSAPQTVTLTNKGSANLKLSKVAIAGSGKADFAIQQNSCVGSLGAGGSCQIGIVFQPKKAGLLGASLNISDNGGGSPQKVGLSGMGR